MTTQDLTPEDRTEIQNLAGRYCHLIDAGKGDQWAELFVDDGVFEIVDLVTSEGREQLAANAKMFPEFTPGGRHVVSSLAIDAVAGDPDRATMAAYLAVVIVGDTPTIRQTGTYADDLVRKDGRWLFARRTLTLDGPLM